jgi:hypothetical protein
LHIAPLLQETIESLKNDLKKAIDIFFLLNTQRDLKVEMNLLMKKDSLEIRRNNRREKKFPFDVGENPNLSYYQYLSSSALFVPFDWNKIEETPFFPTISNSSSNSNLLFSDSNVDLNSIENINNIDSTGLTPLMKVTTVNTRNDICKPTLELNEEHNSSSSSSSSSFEYYKPLKSSSTSLVRHCLFRIITFLRFSFSS